MVFSRENDVLLRFFFRSILGADRLISRLAFWASAERSATGSASYPWFFLRSPENDARRVSASCRLVRFSACAELLDVELAAEPFDYLGKEHVIRRRIMRRAHIARGMAEVISVV